MVTRRAPLCLLESGSGAIKSMTTVAGLDMKKLECVDKWNPPTFFLEQVKEYGISTTANDNNGGFFTSTVWRSHQRSHYW